MIDEAGRLGVTVTDPPGISTSTLTQFPYRRLRRPIYPLDRDATYRPIG